MSNKELIGEYEKRIIRYEKLCNEGVEFNREISLRAKIKLCNRFIIELTNMDEVQVTDNPMSIDGFIRKLKMISPDKRKLPLHIQCPNGLLTEPNIKMVHQNVESPYVGDEITSMVITWRD